MPTIAEIQAQQQALKVMEAENSLPHLNAVLDALKANAVTALATLCQDRAGQIANPGASLQISNIANVLSLSVGNLTRMRDEAALLVPDSD
jgi:hypothetical protein